MCYHVIKRKCRGSQEAAQLQLVLADDGQTRWMKRQRKKDGMERYSMRQRLGLFMIRAG